MSLMGEQQLAERVHQTLTELQAHPHKVKMVGSDEGQVADPWFDLAYYDLRRYTGAEVDENFIRTLTELLADKGVVVKNDTDAELLNFTFSSNT